MIYSNNFIAILDACVLYPASLRDILLSLADHDLYKPKWSEEIQNEWVSNLLKNQDSIVSDDLAYTVRTMNDVFPDANVTGYEDLKTGINLPDPKDNHVLAAAISCGADVIVTVNLKDFPEDYLSKFNIQALDPDTFIENVISLDPVHALLAFKEQVERLKDPPQTINEVLNTLEKNGLTKSVRLFRKILANTKA